MKKYFSFLLIALFGLVLFSCDDRIDDPYVDNDTYSVVYDIKNVNFSYNTTDGYFISKTFNNAIYDSDVILVYRQNGTSGNNPVWQQIPRTLYLSNGDELDYDFDFTKKDIMIYAGGTYDLSTTPQYINNQTFRVVFVPASFGKANVDLSDYNAVIKYFKIDDSKVKTL